MAVYTKETLEAKTVKELRKMCMAAGITGMSKKRKDLLVAALLEKKGGKSKASSKKTSKSKSAGNIAKSAAAKETPPKLNALQFNMTSVETNPSAVKGNKFTTTIRVQSGASHGEFNVIGRKISEIKVILKDVLNVDRFAQAMVNGKLVEDTYVIKETDAVEFIKPAGSKG